MCRGCTSNRVTSSKHSIFSHIMSGNNWEEQFGFFVGCSRPNLVVLHSTSNRLELTTESKKSWRGLDKVVGRKSTCRGENIPPQCRKYSLKIGCENLLAIYFALPVGSYKTILALEKIQLKWSRSTNKNILVSFSSYFFLGGWNSVVLLKHWISCKNREKPTEIPVVDQPQYRFEYFLSLYWPKMSKNNIGKYD